MPSSTVSLCVRHPGRVGQKTWKPPSSSLSKITVNRRAKTHLSLLTLADSGPTRTANSAGNHSPRENRRSTPEFDHSMSFTLPIDSTSAIIRLRKCFLVRWNHGEFASVLAPVGPRRPCAELSLLDSALTQEFGRKPFRMRTYGKPRGEGWGVTAIQRIPNFSDPGRAQNCRQEPWKRLHLAGAAGK